MNKIKLTFYGIIAVLILGLGYKLFSYVDGLRNENIRLHTDLIGKDQKYEQLNQYVAKLEIQYKDETTLRADAASKFADQINQLKGEIKVLSDATFLIKEQARDSKNSDVVFNGPDSKFVLNEVRFENGPPVGYVLILNDGRVVSKLYDHEIHIDTAVSKDETTGRYTILSKADYVLKSPSLDPNKQSWTNKPYQLTITGGLAEVDPTEPLILEKRFFFWNPKLNANLNSDLSGMYAGLGVSFMSYGVTKNDSDFKFLQIGGQYRDDKSLQPTVIPILWRPFSGLLSNTSVGPGAYLDGTQVKYFIGLQVGF